MSPGMPCIKSTVLGHAVARVEATAGKKPVRAEQTEELANLAREAFGWPAAR